jgi:hypothetical protein
MTEKEKRRKYGIKYISKERKERYEKGKKETKSWTKESNIQTERRKKVRRLIEK